MHIHFVLIGEGSSDEDLIPHLEALCIQAGANEVTGVAPDFQRLPEASGKSVRDKLRSTMILEPTANLFLIHRDADQREAAHRYDEISAAVVACGLRQPWAAIVPIQETEAWLLLDEQAIRRVVGKPKGRQALGLPSPARVESLAQPKEALQTALITAADVTGRRLQQLRKDFSNHRRKLLLELPTDGPLAQVPAWQRMRDDIFRAVDLLRQLSDEN